jgi:hypothetical protein
MGDADEPLPRIMVAWVPNLSRAGTVYLAPVSLPFMRSPIYDSNRRATWRPSKAGAPARLRLVADVRALAAWHQGVGRLLTSVDSARWEDCGNLVKSRNSVRHTAAPPTHRPGALDPQRLQDPCQRRQGVSSYRRCPRDNPSCNAFWRNAPCVRLVSLAIFTTGNLLRECCLSSRTSSFVHSRRFAGLVLAT